MKDRIKHALAWLMSLIMLCQSLTGCSDSSPPFLNDIRPENSIREEQIKEKFISEELITESYIIENMIYEDGIYEYVISEDVISEAYVIEVVVGEQTEGEILEQLPAEIEEYDIDWAKIIGKFAVGTTIIITVGIVNHALKGSTYFVFGSPAKVAKDALVGGAIGATLNEIVGSLNNDEMPEKGVTKYALEGFADGYMWGAIASVTKIAAEDFTRLKVLKLAMGGSASIKPDGRVFDEAGKLIGKAYYEKKGLWYLLDETTNAVQVFDKAGKAVTDPALLASIKSLPSNTMLRLGTETPAILCYTDDVGQVIRNGNNLLPNLRYTLNGYTYYTDELGRISKVSFDDLRLRPEGRSRLYISDSKEIIGRGFEQIQDDRGHLIGDMFDGDNTLANIVSMDYSVNRGEVKAVENAWKKCLENGGHVRGSIELTYSGESFRPDGFKYAYDEGKGLVTAIISNIQ